MKPKLKDRDQDPEQKQDLDKLLERVYTDVMSPERLSSIYDDREAWMKQQVLMLIVASAIKLIGASEVDNDDYEVVKAHLSAAIIHIDTILA